MAIAEYLKFDAVSEDEINDLVEHFRQFGKTLYRNDCIKNKDEDESEVEIREESEIWFDYIFENEEYPKKN